MSASPRNSTNCLLVKIIINPRKSIRKYLNLTASAHYCRGGSFWVDFISWACSCWWRWKKNCPFHCSASSLLPFTCSIFFFSVRSVGAPYFLLMEEEKQQPVRVPRVKLGSQGLEVLTIISTSCFPLVWKWIWKLSSSCLYTGQHTLWRISLQAW